MALCSCSRALDTAVGCQRMKLRVSAVKAENRCRFEGGMKEQVNDTLRGMSNDGGLRFVAVSLKLPLSRCPSSECRGRAQIMVSAHVHTQRHTILPRLPDPSRKTLARSVAWLQLFFRRVHCTMANEARYMVKFSGRLGREINSDTELLKAFGLLMGEKSIAVQARMLLENRDNVKTVGRISKYKSSHVTP